MKYTIEGFSQRAVIEFKNDTQSLDCTDLVILRWFIDFKDSGAMSTYEYEGNTYYWVNYDKLISDLPIISMSKRSIYSRMMKLVNFGILTHYHKNKNNESKSCYGIGKEYIRLISDEWSEDNFRGCKKITSEGVGSKLPSKDSSIKDYSTNNKYSPYIPQGDDCGTELVVSKKQEYVEDFDAFYAMYPRHENKSAALKAWKKLKPNAELQAIMAKALMEQKKSPQWKKDGGQYIPYPSTWLNQRRWEDEVKMNDTQDAMFDRLKQKAIEIDKALGNEYAGQGGFWDGIE